MFTRKSTHVHEPEQHSTAVIMKTGEHRYILSYSCKLPGCVFSYAYDMVKEKPSITPDKGVADSGDTAEEEPEKSG